MMVDYAAVLEAIRPGAQWTLYGDDYAGLTWLDEGDAPTQAELDAAWPDVDYQRQYAEVEQARRQRYMSVTDGMFFAAQREGGDLSGWEAAVAAIKDDLPYPDAP